MESEITGQPNSLEKKVLRHVHFRAGLKMGRFIEGGCQMENSPWECFLASPDQTQIRRVCKIEAAPKECRIGTFGGAYFFNPGKMLQGSLFDVEFTRESLNQTIVQQHRFIAVHLGAVEHHFHEQCCLPGIAVAGDEKKTLLPRGGAGVKLQDLGMRLQNETVDQQVKIPNSQLRIWLPKARI